MSEATTIPEEQRHPARWWHRLDDGRIQCDLCPRDCRLRDGQRGYCFVRARSGDELVLTTWGRSSGFCVDPIEKKPLAHFHPGSAVLSFGTAGCNLGCRFCQNFEISTSRRMDRLMDQAGPEDIARAAADWQCTSVAFTYNDPVIFAEYAMDVADACRERGINTVAVTAGYMHDEPRREFYRHMDAANVDLKGFTDDFYRKVTGSTLRPVLDTLVHLKQQTDVWFEITTLLIPGHNDSVDEVRRMCRWVLSELGPDVPHHFTAFHPDNRMRDVPRTPAATLLRAREVALEEGLHFAYVGNVREAEASTTWCPSCGAALLERDGYELLAHRMQGGCCAACGTPIPGVFDEHPGRFGNQRIPVRLAR